MITKWFEVRDAATFIPVIASRQAYPFVEADRYLMARLGFGQDFDAQREHCLLTWVTNSRTESDPWKWGEGTLHTAHDYIRKHFDDLDSGAVIDVQFIRGERNTPQTSEATAQDWEETISRLVAEEKQVLQQENLLDLTEALRGDSPDYFTLWESRN